MYKSLLAGAALIAGAALAAPVVGWSADPGTETAQIAPGEGWWRHHHGDRGREAHETPQQRCEERIARQAGLVAYTIARLNLTAEQKPMWAQVEGALQAAADQQRAICAVAKSSEHTEQTIIDRLDKHQQMLSARLAAIEKIKPLLQSFYGSLTPTQQAIVNHPFRRS
ncbi:MAG TPA: Spy/CpxP family protein refolding chaperone [Stellaceae bacterium]|nr:Spy/CpxP family protein refolding chaperone [Stellaceae bacterium]